eukprot:m.98844 g.98844  ORF g.98844 m.98844 type:complete len:67 (-) comp16760_c0_seq9:49-249(-)
MLLTFFDAELTSDPPNRAKRPPSVFLVGVALAGGSEPTLLSLMVPAQPNTNTTQFHVTRMHLPNAA